MKLTANRERIKRRIQELSLFSETKNSVSRPTYSVSWRKSLDYLKDIMCCLGMNVKLDPVGNLIGETEGFSDDDQKPIAVGSHLDSVINGGAYDGAMGIIVALECMSILRENNITINIPIHIIAFAEEEGSLFGIGCLGSRYMVGNGWGGDLLKIVDKSGISLEEHLISQGTIDAFQDQYGWAVKKYRAFIEPHVEQGPYLEKWGKKIGIVNKVVAINRTGISFYGEANHAGTTPMNNRKDASVGMSKFILKVQEKG
ncbi:MAG: hydantoinase/carbamoylase family amidase [Tepidanaerobacteraceae bacterium]